jgi:hypothetical protein
MLNNKYQILALFLEPYLFAFEPEMTS